VRDDIKDGEEGARAGGGYKGGWRVGRRRV